MLFHAGIPGFGGGFVGVDVFFVISGYLITQLLIGAAAKPARHQLMDFYARRARRILPALFATSLVVAAIAVVIFMPWDLARLGRYLVATSLLGTNIAAWLERIGYFQSQFVPVPIRHFWSIAIEEQFYLVYPLSFIAVSRCFPRRRTTALVVFAAISFGLSVWGSYHAAIANYFLVPSRAWALLLGGALATTAAPARSRLANELFAVIALVTLVFVGCWYGPTTPYPGWYAIAPCAAAAILIETGRHGTTLVGKLLSLRPVVFTGLISYSLYLWHLPILVLFRYYNIRSIGNFGTAALVACIYAVSVVSWKWLETPVRARRLLQSNRSLLWFSLTVTIVILAVGMFLWRSDGLPHRFAPEFRARGHEWLLENNYLQHCINLPVAKIAAADLCSFGPREADVVRGVVWGDSHAMALLPAYQRLAAAHHMRLYFAASSSCRPLLGVVDKSEDDATRKKCADFNAAVAQAVRRLDPRLLILNAHWIDADGDLVSSPNNVRIVGESNFTSAIRETLRQTDSQDRSICVVLDVPTFNYDLPTAIGVARIRGINENFIGLTRAEALLQFRDPERDIGALEQRGILRSVDPKDVLCSGNSCSFESKGNLLYWDNNHLSPAGADFVSTVIDGCFRDIGSRAGK